MKGQSKSPPAPENGDGSKAPPTNMSGLQQNGEFNVGDKITFGLRDGMILLRRKPQGDEVEIGEATLAGLLIETYFVEQKGDVTKK